MPAKLPGTPFCIGIAKALPLSPQKLNWKLTCDCSKFTMPNCVTKFPPSTTWAILSVLVKLSEEGRMVRLKVRLENADALSVTPTVKLEVPVLAGVPLSTPAFDSDSPAGNAPDIKAQA